jgi:hypothetical protein
MLLATIDTKLRANSNLCTLNSALQQPQDFTTAKAGRSIEYEQEVHTALLKHGKNPAPLTLGFATLYMPVIHNYTSITIAHQAEHR